LSFFSFTQKYIFALILLALLSLLSYINVNTLIEQQFNDSKIINLSGKQRMLSQKIYNAAITSNTSNLKKSIDIMEKSHNYLSTLTMSNQIYEFYFNSPKKLDEKVKEYINNAKKIEQNNKSKYKEFIINNSNSLLSDFDEITLLYQLESENKTKWLKEVEFYILLISLFTLASIGFFLFRPANRNFEISAKKIMDEKNYSNMVIESNTNAIIAVDNNLEVKTFNKAAEAIFGYSKEEMLGKNSLENIIPPKHNKSHLNGISNYFKTGSFKYDGKNLELEGIRKNGEIFPIRMSFGKNSNNKEKIVVANIQDITVEKEIASLKENFNRFFELSINLHIICTQEGIIVQVNNACKNILGYDKEELINRSFIELLHKEDIENTLKEMKYLEQGKSSYLFENRYKHKNGTYINLIWSANKDMKNSLIYASAQNITNLKLIEVEKNKQHEIVEQQAKMASMGEMLENIAHQWRQPLSVILTASSGIKFKKELNILEDDDIEMSMTSINSSVQHLSQTIDEFRSFFKTDKIKSEFEIENSFKKAFNLIEAQFKNSNIIIKKDIKNVKLFGFENELIQVLLNILNNARDELIKKEQNKNIILINVNLDKNFVLISIQDNAGGVPNNIINEIFKSHFTTKQDSNGTGIGLYMSKIIIEDHMNGTIEVNNDTFEYEKETYIGANFKIAIPLKDTLL